MPEDVGATIGVQHRRLHPRSEGLMTSGGSSSALIIPTDSSEARLRTGGKSYEKAGSWANKRSRGSVSKSVKHLMPGTVRKSSFDIRHDSMISNLLKRQREQTILPPRAPVHQARAVQLADVSSSKAQQSPTNQCRKKIQSTHREAPPKKHFGKTTSDGHAHLQSALFPSPLPALSASESSGSRSGAASNKSSVVLLISDGATKVTASLDGDVSTMEARAQNRDTIGKVSTKSTSAPATSKTVLTGAGKRVNEIKGIDSSSSFAAASDSLKRSSNELHNDTVANDYATRSDVSSSPSSSVAAAEASCTGARALLEDQVLLTVGTRVEVYWDGEGKYFPGTLTKKSKRSNRGDCFFIEYDDGDREWIHLDREVYRLGEKRTSAQAVVGDSVKPKTLLANIEPSSSAERSSFCSISNKRAILAENRRSSSVVSVAETKLAPSIAKDTSEIPSREERANFATATYKESVVKDPGVSAFESGSVMNQDLDVLVDSSVGPASISSVVFRTDRHPDAQMPSNAEDNWVLAGLPKRLADESSDSETDEEELMNWASKMFGITPRPIAKRKESHHPQRRSPATNRLESISWAPSMRCDLHEEVYIPISEAVKLGRRRRSRSCIAPPPNSISTRKRPQRRTEEEIEAERSKRRKEEAKPLTQAEIKAILSRDLCPEAASTHWVRRSMRQPSRSVLDSPQVKALLDKLRFNDTDMVVLKLKKYVSDPNAPQLVLDAVLDSLEENTNCEALYIQNFNEGMRDEQVLRLLSILKQPSCKIWCLNIGETYKVKTKTWETFAAGLADTNITHMYASEHTITPELKEQIRSTIRDNRGKHSRHCDPENLETIIQCTHCWWNPFNTKSLRPYLKTKGFDYILKDKDLQGLRGSNSGATLA